MKMNVIRSQCITLEIMGFSEMNLHRRSAATERRGITRGGARHDVRKHLSLGCEREGDEEQHEQRHLQDEEEKDLLSPPPRPRSG